jgi:uncharacterized protein YjaG (DUF416 family)
MSLKSVYRNNAIMIQHFAEMLAEMLKEACDAAERESHHITKYFDADFAARDTFMRAVHYMENCFDRQIALLRNLSNEMREKSEANSWTYLKNSKNEAFNEK